MTAQPYTLARWSVATGHEEAFVAAWHELTAFFLSLKAPPRWGTLLSSVDNPRLVYSFGPWPSMETIATMQAHPGIAGAIGELTVLCEETKLGIYLVAAVAGGPHKSGESSTNNSGCRRCSLPEGG